MTLKGFGSWLIRLPRPVKRGVMLVADAAVLPLLVYLAFAVRLGEWLPHVSSGMLLMLVLAPAVAVPLLYGAGFYRAVVRCLGNEVAWIVVGAASVTTLALSSGLFVTRAEGAPRSVVFIFWALCVLYLGGSRFVVRRYLVWALSVGAGRVPVAIYGAGGCGKQLAFALSQTSEYLPRLFIDDDPRLRGTLIQGVRVTGRAQLPRLLRKWGIETVLLAMPSVSRHRRLRIVNFLKSLGVRVKSVPALTDVIAGKARIEDVHDVEIEGLLGRDAVPPNVELLGARIAGRAVMVTGAGGSIGGELCRQILVQRPSRLVLFERGEYELYAIEQELAKQMAQSEQKIELVPVLGSVTCQAHVHAVCREQRVETLFHAAAYKHVPIVEAQPAAGVENNVLGTLSAALAAEAAGVERFVLISTDKAVRPTSVMGATKRFSEVILQALADKPSKTVFTMVRFGNVLGSSGSVVPLFRRQILAGGPVTLTHRDITRYFMTIPEAAQLVIQAGAMAQGGEVFVLDMGRPVKIYDLARSMINLMGFSVRDEDNPDGDIEIRVTGLRPGEKLYEELLIGQDSIGTGHPRIMQAREIRLPWPKVEHIVQQMRLAIERRDTGALRALLCQHVHGYHAGGAAPRVVSLEDKRLQKSGVAAFDGGA